MYFLHSIIRKIKSMLDVFVETCYIYYCKKRMHSSFYARFPTRDLRTVIGAPDLVEYALTGYEFSLYLKILAGLKSYHNVLEVGCGCGRVAGFLLGTIKDPGSYDGFDVVPALIEDATRRLAPFNDRFHFRTFDIYNKFYNPSESALKAGSFVFPYPENHYDIVFLVSVFTHIMPQGLKNYIQQISTVLKSGGKCLSTFFLLSNMPGEGDLWKTEKITQELTRMPLEEDNEFFKVKNPERPEDMIAFDLPYIDKLFLSAQMQRESEPYYGLWSGNPQFISYQDLVVYKKIS
jgi:SAM-dependent methyltransferase